MIEQFIIKQAFTNVTQIDADTVGFDGHHISLEDIEHDMEHDVPTGLIKLYYAEGTTISYRKWLCDNYGM